MRGDADSAYNLGVIRNYRGDAAQPEHWWGRAADAGDDSAIFAPGVTCLNRDDMSGSKTWWLAAARAGNEQAMNNIELMLEDDDPDGTIKDYQWNNTLIAGTTVVAGGVVYQPTTTGLWIVDAQIA